MSSASRVRLAYVKEVTFNTTPTTPVLKSIPFNTGDAFVNNRDTLTSAQVQSTRQPRRTRLGVNQPAKSHAFELQWNTFDELLAAAFGSDWVGGVEVTDDVTVDATSITLDSGTWDELGIHAGDYILFDDDGTEKILYVDSITGTDTVLEVLEADATTSPSLTVDASVSKTIISGFKGARIVASATDTITFDDSDSTVTLAASHTNTWLELGFREGDNIYFDGTASNDGWHKIDTISTNGLVLTLAAAPSAETIDTEIDVDVMTDSGATENGNNLDSFSFEEQFLDHNSGTGNYRVISGVKINSVQFSIQPSSMIVITLDLQGAGITDFDTSSAGASTTDYAEREAFDSFTGRALQDDAEVSITGFDFTLNNAENRNFDLFERNARQMTDGIPQMTGTINAYFDDESQSTRFFNETEFGLYLRSEDPDGNGYALEIVTAKYTGNTASIGDVDVTESLPFNVEPNAAGSEVILRRQPAAR